MGSPGTLGIGELSVGVKTDWNCRSSRWAFVLLSVARWVPCLSGATPLFSCHFDITYTRKGLVLFEARPSLIVLLK